ncbi:MAG TPA: SWIM zinc finger family protein [Anaerolineae bacterium]|nr:SWIM zinc finger family protein [Anaerolineae bacterium]
MPALTHSDVEHWVGGSSFARGRSYFAQDAILTPRRVGSTLKAQCLGSRPQPYHVEAALGANGIVSDDCSCPIGGRCKHVAALLLAWIDAPDQFVMLDDLDTTLAKHSAADLIALVKRMVARYPDLELMLELPTPSAGRARRIDAELIRRQVRHAFAGNRDDWGSLTDIVRALNDIVRLGGEYTARADWRNAAVVYEVVLRGILDEFAGMHDESGDLIAIVNACVQGLGRCLSATADPARREPLLRALFDVATQDITFGGIGLGDEAVPTILEQATPDERRLLARWVRAQLPQGEGWSKDFQRQAFGGFLLDLEQDALDDAAFLRVCRETGRTVDLVDRLLSLNRFDEAMREAQSVDDYVLLQLADLLVKRGQADRAVQVVQERLARSEDWRLPDWLKRQASQRGDWAEALSFADQLFRGRPSLEGYEEVQRLSQSVGDWSARRVDLLKRLAQDNHFGLLTAIHLKEGEVDQALTTIEPVRVGLFGWSADDSLVVRVAQAAEANQPAAAIRLYLRVVKGAIDARGRANYTTAVGQLVRVRELYRRLGQTDAWQALIDELREQNRTLRALKEELNKAGL